MGMLSNTSQQLLLDWLAGNAAAAPQLPLVIKLMATNGDWDTAGTEIVGDAYEQQPIIWGASTSIGVSSSAELSNIQPIIFSSLDDDSDVNVLGIEVWDSGEPEKRIAYATISGGITVPAGEPMVIATGRLKIGIQ